MYAIFHSQSFKTAKEANPYKFNTEKWFCRDFCVDTISDEDKKRFKEAQVALDAPMGHPPPNTFMPRNIFPNKASRANPEKSKKPSLIINEENLQVFFKQDDTFDSPMVELRCKLSTTDCEFPLSTESLIFSMMWVNMLNESHRELTYMA
mmetsp:Transcript_5568/g.8772  ORF Transcript_5568/g.8772 Transcript_5568/m.8772 type:complete len:150 (+) Transcript_5568:1298-1747(+)